MAVPELTAAGVWIATRAVSPAGPARSIAVARPSSPSVSTITRRDANSMPLSVLLARPAEERDPDDEHRIVDVRALCDLGLSSPRRFAAKGELQSGQHEDEAQTLGCLAQGDDLRHQVGL